ncbi:MAG: response regulator transcription factor [Clostridia bacterium]|jgi:DNA-binding response OmpR family regulator|nr:response regulator transcription factor [Clostridia bacterium]
MKEKPYILVVDDDPNISRLVTLYLEREGYEVKTAARGDDAVNEFTRLPPDMMLLDVMLPGMDGYQVLKSVRKSSAIPVIMLTARDETFDKVLGLELGADDYITKPFDAKELVARVKAVLRRTQGGEEEKKNDLSFPGLTVSLAEYAVYYEGKRIEMPPKELEVFYFLASSPNQVFTREQLLKQVWGFDFFGDSRTVDVHIKRLREKLPESEKYGWSIHTVRGVGYKFELN